MRRCKRITDTGTKVQSTEALWLKLDSILIAHIPQFDWAVPSPLTGQSILQWIGSCQLKGFRLKHPLSMFEYFRISSGHLYVYSKSTRYSIDIYRSSLECMISQGYSVDIYWTVVLGSYWSYGMVSFISSYHGLSNFKNSNYSTRGLKCPLVSTSSN